MPKKYHKLHRHRDKHSSRTRHHRKHRKEHAAAQNPLEPIQEVSKEKVRVDKNACGDYIHVSLMKTHIEDEKAKRPKHSKEKSKKHDKVEREKGERNIFGKNYIKEVEESVKEKAVRHQSLEKTGNSLLTKTKLLFRKEKSFNDAVEKVSDLKYDTIKSDGKKREEKRKHRSRKAKENDFNENTKEKKHIEIVEAVPEKKPENQITEKRSKHTKEKHNKSHRRKHKSKNKSPEFDKKMYNRVQEVIYCQMNHIPYKMRNDKSASEIKDLYQRMKKDKRRDKSRDEIDKYRSPSLGDKRKNYDPNQERKFDSYYGHIEHKPKLHHEEKTAERYRKLDNLKQRERLKREENSSETRHQEDHPKERHHKQGHPPHIVDSKVLARKKHKNERLSEISLGPYEKYFAFEQKYHSDHCNKIHKKGHDNTSKSVDRRHKHKREERDHREERHYVEESHPGKILRSDCSKLPEESRYPAERRYPQETRHQEETHHAGERRHPEEKRHSEEKHHLDEKPPQEKHKHKYRNSSPGKQEQRDDSPKIEEEQIHQIVEGDLKSYFCKIQTMIDKKLDALIQMSKGKHDQQKKAKEDRKDRKRSTSKTKENLPENDANDKKEKEDKKKRKHSGQKEEEKLTKEEIVNEVLKRLREEKILNEENKAKSESNNEKLEVPKPNNSSKESFRREHSDRRPKNQELNDKVHVLKMDSLRSTEKRNISEDLMQAYVSKLKKVAESKSIGSKNINDDAVKHTHASRKSLERHRDSRNVMHSEQTKPSRHREHYEYTEDQDRYHHYSSKRCEPFTENLQTAKDSLEHTRYRSEEGNSLKVAKRQRCPQTYISPRNDDILPAMSKPYASSSSARTFSEQQLVLDRHNLHLYSASEETMREKYYEERRGSSSPGRYTERVNITSQYAKMRHKRQEEEKGKEDTRVPKDKIHEHFQQNPYRKYLCSSPPRYHSKHNTSTQDPEPFLEEIFLPPEKFRCPTNVIYNRQLSKKTEGAPQKHQFIVQGIEPPILDGATNTSRRNVPVRKLECKTVSVIHIHPQIEIKELPIANQTQTSSKSHKSSITDRDLVEKRKKSKRFKLYYKYSVADNAQEQNDLSSDARSIVSDSYRVVSDPSEERILPREQKNEQKYWMDSEVSQVIPATPKKWNRISTPRDSHLNNIMEEPSNLSDSTLNQDYFVPLQGTREYYCRALTSSHSDYCLKIDKKPANSNISVLSKDTWDGRNAYCDNKKCRYHRPYVRSKSDCKLASKITDHSIPRSRSDVFLDGNKGKQVIRSIFRNENDHLVRNRQVKQTQKCEFDYKNFSKAKETLKTSCKECQTIEDKPNGSAAHVEEETKQVLENKQKQFAQIYKTIDTLEENIHSSMYVPPKTVNAAVSAMCLRPEDSISKKTQMVTGTNLKDRVIQTPREEPIRKVDAAIGSPVRSRRSERTRRSLSVKKIHDIAVGDSEVKVLQTQKLPRSRSEKVEHTDNKHLKSTAVSPIRIVEETVTQIKAKSPVRKVITPKAPKVNQLVLRMAGPKRPKNTPENSPLRTSTTKVTQPKNEPLSENFTKVQNVIRKEANQISPARATHQHTAKDADIPQKPLQCIGMFRSDVKSPKLKKQRSDIQSNMKAVKSPEPAESYTSHNNQKTKRGTFNKQPAFTKSRPEESRPVIIKTQEENEVCKADKRQKKQVSNAPCEGTNELCFHQASPRKPMTPIVRKHLIVNAAATYHCRSPNSARIKNTESSTSSSVSDVESQLIRRSKSLVEIKPHKADFSRSKSEISRTQKSLIRHENDQKNTRDGSVLSNNMEKFANVPNIRCAGSKSHGTALDNYIEEKFTSKLFLTKDYKGASTSAYQKRKLYDQLIRQKMKKKTKTSKVDVRPQIFEVRFLSMVNQDNDQRSYNGHQIINSFEKPRASLNMGRVSDKNSIYRKACCSEPNNSVNCIRYVSDLPAHKNRIMIDKANNLKAKERNLIFDCLSNNPKIAEVHPVSNKISIEHQNCYPNKTEIDRDIHREKLTNMCKKFLDTNSICNKDILNNISCTCTQFSRNCTSCRNFVNVIDSIYSSMAKYRIAEINSDLCADDSTACLVENYKTKGQQITTNANTKSENGPEIPKVKPRKEKFKVEEIFSASYNKITSDSSQSAARSRHNSVNPIECFSLETVEETDSPILTQPMSCPILTTNSSSFEYLYEESSSSENEIVSRDTIFANLTRPFDQTFSFSTSQYNVETPFFRASNFESTTGSVDSGYTSVKSKSCCSNSLTNFFKKPNITALFRSPVLTKKKEDIDVNHQNDLGNHDKDGIYEEMTKNCQLYAKKVRQISEMKLDGTVDEYQEFSLKVLLGKTGSVVLESRALSVQSVESHSEDRNKDVEQDKEEMEINSFNAEDQCLEIPSTVSSCEDISRANKQSFSENGCKLILSNDCLRVKSITYLGAEIFIDDGKSIDVKASVMKEIFNKNDTNYEKLNNQQSSATLDFSLDSNNPFVTNNDSSTKQFFTSLIKTYEKEMEICNRLYKDEIFEDVLLSAVKERQNQGKKNKKGRFYKFFKKKSSEHTEKRECEKEVELQKKASTRLQILATNAKKCFTMLADAVKVNENIDDELKICGLLRLLERIEKGDFEMLQNDEQVNLEEEIKSQVTEAFTNIYDFCQREAKKHKKRLSTKEMKLIKSFVIKHRIGLLTKTDVVASYISRGFIQTEDQLKTAVTFLMRSQSHELNIKEFEEYCKFTK